ncbi:DsbA family protein [Kosakonia oryzendophytica]|uniref:DsbA family protein n=1 Tax=Kosakonia oryzendophytica TaxID=1005665 RepID=UPI003D34DBA4
MNNFTFPEQAVIYVMDAYCGWCWGFSKRMAEFEAANRHRIAFTVISGGLFLDDRAVPLSSYPYIPQANERIASLTGAEFGTGYKTLLDKGEAVMDSLAAAEGLAVLRSLSPERAVHWAHELQAAFYGQGLSLSDPATITGIAKAHGFDDAAVLSALQDGSAMAQARQDFAIARQLGVTSYPTLLYINDGVLHPLPATGTPLDVLNQTLDALMG